MGLGLILTIIGVGAFVALIVVVIDAGTPMVNGARALVDRDGYEVREGVRHGDGE